MIHWISIIGAPLSGKSALALALEDRLLRDDIDCVECRTPIAVVDDYVFDATERMNLAGGFEGNYLINLEIALARYGLQRRAVEDGAKTIITVGSVFETSTYVAMEFERNQEFDNEGEKLDDLRRTEATLKALACMYMDANPHRHVFYCPPLKGADDQRIVTFDRNLQAAFNAFGLINVVPLLVDDGNIFDITKQRLETVMEIIMGGEDAGNPERADASATSAE